MKKEDLKHLQVTFWDATDASGITARCIFNTEDKTYTVEVFKGDIKKSKSFPAAWGDPRFGMDIQDQNQSILIAEELADELDKELEQCDTCS